jgi:sugar/nucleoside kinase (ribokinase family)
MSSTKSCDVVVFGDLFIDLVMTGFSRLPELGEEALGSGFRRETGGGAAHTSCGLAVLGARTKVIGVVGATEVDWFRGRLKSKGVNTQALVVSPGESTAITVAISTERDRIFYTYPGANGLLPQLLTNVDTRRQMAEARHVHFAHLVEPARLDELTRWLHAEGCTVSVDVGWDESWLDNPASLKALAKIDWFFPNEREAGRMTGESDPRRILECFRNQGLDGVVLKLGPEGSASLFRGEVLRRPALPVQPVDTTGAGDCFDAGFLFAWLNRMTIEESLAWGNVCGALSTRRSGGIEGFPSREEVENVLTR